MEAASKIIFGEDEYLDVQAAALQNYLQNQEVHSVKLGAMAAGKVIHCKIANSIIYSGVSATFVSNANKLSNSTKRNAQIRTSNGQICYTTLVGKTALPIGTKVIYQPALAAPTFAEYLISLAQLTAKGNKILFKKTKTVCF